MAKFYGVIGFAHTEETSPGVYEERLTERPYYGDIMRSTRRWESGEKLHDDLTLNNTLSVIADSFANENLFAMRYVKWAGACWKITNVEIQWPRLLLTVGGVYHGPEGEAASTP